MAKSGVGGPGLVLAAWILALSAFSSATAPARGEEHGRVFDTPHHLEQDELGCIVNHGITTVARYYNFGDSPNLPHKQITPEEARLLSENNFEIVMIFQAQNDSPDDFSAHHGHHAAKQALELAEKIGQPTGTAIYFVVDFDAGRYGMTRIVEYFTAVRKHFEESGRGYRIGAYGSGFVVSELEKRGLADYTWVAVAPLWRGTQDYLDGGDWNLHQHRAEQACGKEGNYNRINRSNAAYGGFMVE